MKNYIPPYQITDEILTPIGKKSPASNAVG